MNDTKALSNLVEWIADADPQAGAWDAADYEQFATECIVRAKALQSAGEDERRREFDRYAQFFGLQAGDMGRTFVCQGTQYRIEGLNTRRPKFPVEATRTRDGKRYKFGAETVARLLVRNKA